MKKEQTELSLRPSLEGKSGDELQHRMLLGTLSPFPEDMPAALRRPNPFPKQSIGLTMIEKMRGMRLRGQTGQKQEAMARTR